MTSTDIPRIRIETGAELAAVVEAGTPVVMQGALGDAGLHNVNSLESFVDRFADLPVTVSRNIVDEQLDAVIAYCRNRHKREAQNRFTSTVETYVQEMYSNPKTPNLISEQAASRELLAALQVPKALREFGINMLRGGGEGLTQTNAECWWFLANAGNASDLHTDWDGCHVLNQQVFGRKHWILFPPSSADRLGVFDIFPTVMLREMSQQQIDDFLPYAEGVQTVLQPGETIYIPPFYYHHADYLDHGLGVAFRFCPPPDDVRKLINLLHRSPSLQNLYRFAIQDLDKAKPALDELEEAYQTRYPNVTLKYRAIEELAQALCQRLGLLTRHWKLPPAVFLEPMLAAQYHQSPRPQREHESTLPLGLTDGDIYTESLLHDDRAANSAAIETTDAGPLLSPLGWADSGSQSEQVRELLHPFSLDHFFYTYFEQSALYIERGDVSRPHEGIYSVASLLEDFRRQRIPIQSINFSADTPSGRRISLPPQRFAMGALAPGRMTDHPLSPLHFERVAEYVENGTGSLVVSRIDQFVLPIHELILELGEALSGWTQATAYYTPRAARTLELHWDTHDVIVLQLEGQKHWQVFEPLLPLPIEDRDYMASAAFEGYEEVLESEQFLLKPGDFLYLPRGVPHRAWTDESPSLHLTVGLLHPTWIGVLGGAVAEALRTCEKQLSFRRVCPAAFPNVAEQEVRNVFEQLTTSLTQEVLNADLRRLVAKHTCTAPLIFGGEREAAPHPQMKLARVPGVHFHQHDEEGAEMVFQGKRMRFPPVASDAIDFVAQYRQFCVHELPGLTGDEQLVFAQRLMREGFLRVAE